MFKIEITLYSIDKQSEQNIEMSGDTLLSLKSELSDALLNNIHDTGCYNVETIITEDCEYYDSDEFDVYIDVENQKVTQMVTFT